MAKSRKIFNGEHLPTYNHTIKTKKLVKKKTVYNYKKLNIRKTIEMCVKEINELGFNSLQSS